MRKRFLGLTGLLLSAVLLCGVGQTVLAGPQPPQPAPDSEAQPAREGPAADPGADKTPLSGQSLHLRVNGYELELPLAQSGAAFDVPTMNTEYPNTVELLNVVEDAAVTVDGKALATGDTAEVEVDRIAYDETIEITVETGGDSRSVHLRTLNSAIPTYTAVGESPHEGHYYLTMLTLPVMLKLDGTGEIVYYLCGPEAAQGEAVELASAATATGSEAITHSYWDFKKHVLPGGEVRYSYHEQDPGFNRLNLFGYAGGQRVILDEQYREIQRIGLEAGSATSLNTVEGHDFTLIDDGHYIVSNYELQLVHNIPEELKPNPQGSKVIAAHLQEVKDGKVLLDWYSTDHEELYALSEAPYNDYANAESQQPDYAHFNSVGIDPEDGNLVCSFRNLSTILKIDRESGDILWKLSGLGDEFGLREDQKTSNQHYARCNEDGSITVFDNGVKNGETRVLKLMLDEEDKELVAYDEYLVPGHFSLVCGSAMLLEDEVFVIGWGGSTVDLASLTEIDFESGQKLFELTFPAGLNATYRCVKYA